MRVNAVANLMQSEAVSQCISDVVGVVAHHKRVAAQPPAKQNGGDDPEPEPAPEPAPEGGEAQG